MRVLVTGGAGFIGSHLVDRLLAEGNDVAVLDSLEAQVHGGERPDYLDGGADLIVGDVRDPEAVRRALRGVDRLVHLAATVGVGQSMYQIERYTSSNTLGAAVVLEQASECRDALEKVVVASSMSIYGEGLYRCPAEGSERLAEPRSDEQLARREWEPVCPSCGSVLEALPTPERKPLRPASIYAITKRDHEEMFLVWGRAYGVPTTALRFFNVYGPRQALSNPYTGLPAIFASRLLNGRSPLIFEDGLQLRDFVHVSDAVRAILAALDPSRAAGSALNVGTGVGTSVVEVARVLARLLEANVEPLVLNRARAGDIRHCFADATAGRDALGLTAAVSFEDGMRDLVGWLAGRKASDLVDEATAMLEERGLTR